MNINGKFNIHLSLESVENYKKMLENYSKELPMVAVNIVKRTSDVGLENNYSSTKMIPVEISGTKITGGIKTTDVGETYAEFGTGIVGSNNPHVAEWLSKSGWKYDVNEHGEAGWIYIKDGQTYWTKGIEAQKKFYEASERMEERFFEIAAEEFKKIIDRR